MDEFILICFKWILSIIVIMISFIYSIRYIMSGKSYDYNSKNLTDKIIVITGANCGIGEETARILAYLGGIIVLACRSENEANKTIKYIKEKTGNINIRFIKLDLSNFESINEFADNFKKIYSRIDILINNAGVMLPPPSFTSNGLEMHMGVNHIGHFLLTYKLLPLILNASKPRIIVVSSHLHKQCNAIDEDIFKLKDPKSNKGFTGYIQSKFANVVFVKELQERLIKHGKDNVLVLAANPGVVATNITRYLHPILVFISVIISKLFLKSATAGAQTIIYAATNDDLVKYRGAYLDNCQIAKYNQLADDKETRTKIWKYSEELSNIEFNIT